MLQRIETALELTVAPKDTLQRQSGSLNRSHTTGKNRGLTKVLDTMARTARTNTSVLITSKSGTGEEPITEAIYINSQHTRQPFMKVSFGGISWSLSKNEMFDHEEGAFADTTFDRMRRFEVMSKGTVFLDEIGNLDPSYRVKLLWALQDQIFEVLGNSRPRKTDIRVISVTNTDLAKIVNEHIFRKGLFYRISLIAIKPPVLGEYREGISLLARHFADRQARISNLPCMEFSSDTLSFLNRLSLPGGIRESKNLVERMILVSGKGVLDTADLGSQYQRYDENTSAASSFVRMILDEIEGQTILQALKRYRGNLNQMATALGISRTVSYRRSERYDISNK